MPYRSRVSPLLSAHVPLQAVLTQDSLNRVAALIHSEQLRLSHSAPCSDVIPSVLRAAARIMGGRLSSWTLRRATVAAT
eukprot:CAMPEP_0114271792 /NCGR_PEP_ID=MMETSP0058-20121206/28056_1 /TAXON_ID=36894 /ORGANISM="Pyramimonas parkeae, CCMP726" /LENGTH=78 /DNA_ID=CAMNT_0001390811 /DNA_START=156 /DNA_END=388 /DNA_ORIENTATION=-